MLFRKAIGRLVASPLFTAFAVLSLAAGVAVTTAVYSVVDTLMFPRFEVRDPSSIAFLVTPRNGVMRRTSIASDDLDALKHAARSFDRLSGTTAFFVPVASTRNSELMTVEAVDEDYFATLGLVAATGRLLGAADHAGGARVAVISEEYWRTRLAADPQVVGRTITINGLTFDVAGVAARYGGIESRVFKTHAWIPLSLGPLFRRDLSGPDRRGREQLTVVGRVAPGVTHVAAAAEIEAVAAQLDAAQPLPVTSPLAPPRARRWSSRAVAALDEDDGMTRTGIVLVILVALVLVVACTNLANLVLARGSARQGELAIRMAMGASRGRVIWEQCIEGLILSCLGAVAAYAVFIALSAWMTQDFSVPLPAGMGRFTLSIRPEINADALAVSIAALLLSLAVFSLEPAVQLARSLDIRTVLAVGTGVRPRVGRQRMIIRWQVALATGFFIVATMFIRFTIEQARHYSGIDTNRIAIATLNMQGPSWAAPRTRQTVDRLLQEVAKEPSIEAVSASTGLPFGIAPALEVAMRRPGSQESTASASSSVLAVAATPLVFRVLGIPILQGRGFNDSDGPATPRVAVLSEFAAKQGFPSTNPIGQPLVLTVQGVRSTVTVIGISRDTDVANLNSRRRPLIFLPLTQYFDPEITITARARGDVPAAVAALRETVRRTDPDIRVEAAGDGRLLSGISEVVNSAGRGVIYLGTFTLLLSMVGLFGVQSHVVAFRTREFGVRMSLGASARQIKAMVLRDGARPVIDGLILGLWGGLAGRMLIRAYTDLEVTVLDPWMLALSPVPIVAAALAACYWPAARAARVDPTTALRYE